MKQNNGQPADLTKLGVKLPDSVMNNISEKTADLAGEALDASGIYAKVSAGMADFILNGISFFIAFAAAILYTAGMLTAQSNQRLKEERCYQLAKSYSDVLKNELIKYDKKYADDGSTVYNFTVSAQYYQVAQAQAAQESANQ